MSGNAIWYVRWSKSILYTLIATNAASAPPAMAMMVSWSRTPIHSSPTGAISPFMTPNDTPKNTAITIMRMGGTARTRTFLMARGGRGTLRLKWTKHPMLIRGSKATIICAASMGSRLMTRYATAASSSAATL